MCCEEGFNRTVCGNVRGGAKIRKSLFDEIAKERASRPARPPAMPLLDMARNLKKIESFFLALATGIGDEIF